MVGWWLIPWNDISFIRVSFSTIIGNWQTERFQILCTRADTVGLSGCCCRGRSLSRWCRGWRWNENWNNDWSCCNNFFFRYAAVREEKSDVFANNFLLAELPNERSFSVNYSSLVRINPCFKQCSHKQLALKWSVAAFHSPWSAGFWPEKRKRQFKSICCKLVHWTLQSSPNRD